MVWKNDPELAKAAGRILGAEGVTARRNGDQVLLRGTPYGRVEILRLEGGYLVAAERPPSGPAAGAPLSEDLRHHLEKHELQPVFTVRTEDPADALRALADFTGDSAEDWSPFLLPVRTDAALVGEARIRRSEEAQAFLSARGAGDPLLAVSGPRGIGRRTLLATAAMRAGRKAVELPLGRILVPERVLKSPLEMLLETTLAAVEALDESRILIVSDGEILSRVTSPAREQALLELSRLPRLALVATAAPAGVVDLPCPGLAGGGEVEELLAAEGPEPVFLGPALTMLAAAAKVEGHGILPGRLLFLVRLARTIAGPDAGELPPDAVLPAIRAAARAWVTP